MKDILRQLLDADGAGRQAAKAKEAAARELLDRAREQAERVVAESRERVARDIAAVEFQTDQEIARQQAAIARETEAELERTRRDGDRLRARAVAAVVAQLLGEPRAEADPRHDP